MSKDFKWKDCLLKSGLPLEYEVKQLLDRKGCVSNMVNSYVQNRQQPRLEILFEIAKILDVDPKELINAEHE